MQRHKDTEMNPKVSRERQRRREAENNEGSEYRCVRRERRCSLRLVESAGCTGLC